MNWYVYFQERDMYYRIQIAFLLIVIIQAFHSVEEYYGRLWEVLPPAGFICKAVSDDPKTGFLIINIGLFVVGILYGVACVRKNKIYATEIIWFWIVIEIINGIGHPVWGLIEKAYVPGLITAPLLLLIAIYLTYCLFKYDSEK